MTTIDGKALNLSEIIIYNRVTELGEDRIALLLRHADETLEKTRVIYSDENLDEIIKGMKQISTIELDENNRIKVKYEDETEVVFPITRMELLRSIKEAQKEAKNSKVIVDNWDQNVEEKSEDAVSNSNKDKKVSKSNNKKFNQTLAGILAGTVLLGSAYLLGSKKSKEDTETPTVQTTPQKTSATYLFNIDNRNVLEQQAQKLYKEVMTKDIEYLTSGQVMMTSAGGIVTFDETIALEVIEYLQGLYPQNMKNMSVEDANIEREKIEQAIILISASYIKSQENTSKSLDLSKYISNSEERALFKDALTYSKGVWDAREEVSILGKVIDKEEEFNNANKEYIKAEEDLQKFVRYAIVSQAYAKASVLTQRSIIAPLQIGIGGIRHWSYVMDKSQDETVFAEYPFIYYVDNRNNTTWEPKTPETQEDLDLEGQEIYIEIDQNDVATGRNLTSSEMQAYDDENDNVIKRGTEKFFEDELQRVIGGIQNKIELGSNTKTR